MYDSLNGEPVHLFPQYYFQDKPDMPIYSCQGTGKTYVSGDKLPLSSPAYHYPDNFLIFDPSPLDDQLDYVLHVVKNGRLTDSFCHAKNPNYRTPNSHFQPIPDHIQSLLDTNLIVYSQSPMIYMCLLSADQLADAAATIKELLWSRQSLIRKWKKLYHDSPFPPLCINTFPDTQEIPMIAQWMDATDHMLSDTNTNLYQKERIQTYSVFKQQGCGLTAALFCHNIYYISHHLLYFSSLAKTTMTIMIPRSCL